MNARLPLRKAFHGPTGWVERRVGRWQDRQCSTPGCIGRATWMIAHSRVSGYARYACDACKKRVYWAIEEVAT